MRGLNGKRIFISGGCGDIGRAVAQRFLEEGASIVLADLRDGGVCQSLEDQFIPGRVHFVSCDVTSPASVDEAFAAAVEWFGGLDVIISNAGTVSNQPFAEITTEKWQRTLDVNLTGSFLIAQAGLRILRKNARIGHGLRGVILFTGSWVQQMPWPHAASYCVSKAGQEMLMKVIAQEAASEGISCNVVAPGMVYAGLTREIYDRDPAFRQACDQVVPAGRMSSAEELAGAFAFLASDDARYITGTTFLVDGGASLVRRDI
ncbi:glucose 1-dehydrogenase [Terrimicrobium sacchariphilum]|uniref:Glucose 1-dehydrogenase n=1 Tax=Terrimicrobium sacchariphilum TaxID=690879 RepID=A0A146GET6_TERSA|nr:SDR family oxidoreductase [Terrimicrobium sacchariphilum]GAT35184.1 glucose 1-dehydrogenase [Terrimicrobium sacchariphilum]